MVQFNLLPDVKLEYIKAQRLRRVVFGASFIASVAAITLLVLLLSVSALQRKHLSDLSKDIQRESQTLKSKPNINTILTVQNQLGSLTALHDAKPAAARLSSYLNALTPASVSISSLNIDFTTNTITISGNADSLSSVNQFVDTMKLTTYNATDADKQTTKGPAFSSVVLSSFGLSTTSKDKSQAASYSISVTYDPVIFDVTQDVSLNVPTITTHAQLQTANDLFKAGGSN